MPVTAGSHSCFLWRFSVSSPVSLALHICWRWRQTAATADAQGSKPSFHAILFECLSVCLPITAAVGVSVRAALPPLLAALGTAEPEWEGGCPREVNHRAGDLEKHIPLL